MTSSDDPRHPFGRPSARRWAGALAALAVLATVPFWLTELDVAVAGWFFDPDHPDGPWPLGRQWPWTLLYRIAPVLSAALGLGSLAVMVAASRPPGRPRLFRAGLVVFLTLALGPGILVNIVFKDHWGRPRPNHLVEFGGSWDYLPPLAKGEAGRGKSFPCGHASVGFAAAAIALGLGRRRPRTAIAVWVTALGTGSLLGITRMVAGNHFLSDVLWAALMTIGVAVGLHRLIHPRSDRPPPVVTVLGRARPVVPTLSALLAVMVIAAALLATPMYKEIRWRSPHLAPGSRHAVSVDIDRADVRLELVDVEHPRLEVDIVIQGFGLPGGDVRRAGEVVRGDPAIVRYSLASEGRFTDLDASVVLKVATRGLDSVNLTVGRGNITVVAPAAAERPSELGLHTGDGVVHEATEPGR